MAVTELIEQQTSQPLAFIHGQAFLETPADLYIPPDALEVFLEVFIGPFDLLLYLIKKQNIDILNIPIAQITEQYLEYIKLMESYRFELAAEYLVMAATLAEIKSRMLLPRPQESEEEEEDPRAALVRRLLEYEQIKQAAERMDALPREGRDTFVVVPILHETLVNTAPPDLKLNELLLAFREVLLRTDLNKAHLISREPLSVRERMTRVLERIESESFIEFSELFDVAEGRAGLVVTFLAILELAKECLIEIIQAEAFSQIHIRLHGSFNGNSISE